jgi:hypothetical protein
MRSKRFSSAVYGWGVAHVYASAFLSIYALRNSVGNQYTMADKATNTAHLTDSDIKMLRVILLDYALDRMADSREVEVTAHPFTGARDICIQWAKDARRIQAKLRAGDTSPGG